MNMHTLVAAANIGVLFLLGAGIAAEAAEVRLLSNNSMRVVMKEVGPKFEHATGHKLVVEFTVPREIEKRIRDGKTFDVVIGPEINFPKSQVVPGSVTPVARSVLAMAVRKGASKPDISSPDAVKRTLLAAKSITYSKNSNPGIHIAKLLERWGIADQLKPKLIFDGNVRNLVEKGEAEIGVHILSALIDSPGIEVVGALPDDLQESDGTFAAIMASATDMSAAKALIDFLRTPEAVAVIKAKGLAPAAP